MNYTQPDRPNYEHPDMCGEDMTPDDELDRTEATCDYYDHTLFGPECDEHFEHQPISRGSDDDVYVPALSEPTLPADLNDWLKQETHIIQ